VVNSQFSIEFDEGILIEMEKKVVLGTSWLENDKFLFYETLPFSNTSTES
jgi:hypothetical protein